MHGPRILTALRDGTLLAAALTFSLVPAGAQLATSNETSAPVAGESSSNTLQLADNGTLGEFAALPAAPAKSSSGGGQYDNRGGSSGGGLMSHLTYELGGGGNAPTGSSSPYITWGANFTVGGGYRFNKMFSLMTEYQFIDDKIPGALIAEAAASGGHDHIWSLTLDPVVDLLPKGKIDIYVTGGGGFYRKVTSFTDPQQTTYCDYYYCGVGTQNVVVGHFSSNQGGFSFGGGIAHRFGGFTGDGKMKIFAEARYLDVMSPAVITQANGLGTTTVGAGTKIIPVTFGVRW